MTPKQRAVERIRRLEQAMFPLVTDPRFKEFLELVEDLKNQAVDFAITHDSIKSDRTTLASLGEVRAYNDILGVAENYRQQLENKAERDAEIAEQAQ